MIDLEREREAFEATIAQKEIESLKAQLEAKNNAILFTDECRIEWYELAMRKDKELQEVKAQLAQYQSDDYVSVPKVPSEAIKNQINEVIAESIYVETSWGGVNTAQFECGTDEVVYKAMIEAQEKKDA